MAKKVKCDFPKMGTRILPKPGRHPERYKKIEKEKKKRMDEWRKWWS